MINLNKMQGGASLFVFGVILTMLIISLAFMGSYKERSQEPVKSMSSLNYYKVITVEGMPCIHMPAHGDGGLTCDWSKYDPK